MSDLVGRPQRRVEDRPLLTGNGQFVSDLAMRTGVAHVAFVRSPHASAFIVGLETRAARAAPGIIGLVVPDDVADLSPLLAPGPPFLPDFPRSPAFHVLPRDRVRFVGQPVVAVVATSAPAARDAADLVAVDYDPLPAVADVAQAVEPGAPLVHPDFPANILARHEHIAGDPAGVFGAAAHVLRMRLRHARVAPVAMEPRAILAEIDPASGRLVVWLSTQAPFLARSDICHVLNVGEDQVRVIAPDVGGGFGAKALVHVEEMLVATIAMRLKQPVAWVATRSEDLATTMQGRDMLTHVEAAVASDGTIVGMRLTTLANIGAYAVWQGPLPAMRLLAYPTGCYRIKHLQSEVLCVLTNTTPTGPYRGAGRPEAAFVAERVVDEAAAQLGLDPAEVRRRNFIAPDEFPYATAGGVTYDSGNYPAVLATALQVVDIADLRREQVQRRARGELVGIGLATYTEVAGGGFEGGLVSVEADGSVTACTGSSAHGQGHQTTFAQIVADQLGVAFGAVSVRAVDTDGPIRGIGTFGSRSVVLGGSALHEAAGVVRERALRVAATLLEVSPADLDLRDGRCVVRGAADRAVDLSVVASATAQGTGLNADEPHVLSASARFVSTDGDTFPFGAIVAVVSIDRDSGRVQLERLVVVDDCGRVINPLLVDGQLAGGAAQGIGQALQEAMAYGEDGQILTGTLMDYALPRAADLPWLELHRTQTLSPRNPLGAKGVGESATVGTPAAIANAVADALRPLDGGTVELPLTGEKLWQRLKQLR